MPSLTADRLDEYLAVAFPGGTSDARRARLLHRLEDPAWAGRRRYTCDAQGRVAAVTWLVPAGRQILRLVPIRSPGPIDERAARLVDEALDVARAEGARRVDLRLEERRWSAPLEAACRRTGGVEGAGRVEHGAPLDALPGPLPGDARITLGPAPDEAAAAEVLARCAVDSPDALEPDETAARVVQDMLNHPNRSCDLARVLHVGRRAEAPGGSPSGRGTPPDRAIAFVCAQVDPAAGWSTITFLGLAPEVRGEGLGPVLQRHGFAMLRAQGGVRYRGGTSLDNAPMRACFARNGVPEVARYREVRWTLSPRPPGGSS